MHSYASDSVDRSIVPWVLAVIAVGIAYSLSLGASALKVEFPWWAQAPSVMSVYGLLYYIYSHIFFSVTGYFTGTGRKTCRRHTLLYNGIV